MADNSHFGHRVLAEITAFPTSEGGLDFEIRSRTRSLLFVFPPIEDEPNQQGALIERVIGDGHPGSTFLAEVRFFDDSATISATLGAEFELWLGRMVGHGSIAEVLPDL